VLKYLLDISELHNQQNLTVNTYDVLHILRHPCVGIEMGGGEQNVLIKQRKLQRRHCYHQNIILGVNKESKNHNERYSAEVVISSGGSERLH